MEVELQSSAAVPCHISAEHDSRTLKCGNALGTSPRTQTRLHPLQIPHDPGYPTAGCEQRTLTGVCRAQTEIGRLEEVPPTAGADGTAERNPEDALRLGEISSLIARLPSL